jgi:hypothetical protein
MQLKADEPGAGEVAPETKPLHRDRIALGMAAAVASFFMLNTMNVFAKLLSPRPARQRSVYRRRAPLRRTMSAADGRIRPPRIRSYPSRFKGALCER